jgi:anaerobic selenocysteine-containing dehydrogenase
MKLSRRDFLKWAGLSAVGAVACNVFDDREMTTQSPLAMPEDLVTGQTNWYATLCNQCPEREGIYVRVTEGRAKKVRGSPLYPTNQGKQSARCEGGLQALYHPNRIAGPMIRPAGGSRGEFVETTWDNALAELENRLRGMDDPRAMMMITEPLRGHLGLVVNRFVDTYGGRHLAFESMEQTGLRTAVKDLFGQDTLPNFDVENSRYLLSFGADLLSTWVSPVRYSRGYGEFRSSIGKERGTHVHADPRYSVTAASADEWIPVSPGREGILALAIAYTLVEEDLADPEAVAAMSGGAGKDALLSALDPFRPERIVSSSDPNYVGIPERIRGEDAAHLIRRVANEFATRSPGLAIGGGEAGAHTNGLFNLKAIFALNYLVGSVGKRPGQGGIVFNPPSPLDDVQASPPYGSMDNWAEVSEELRSGEVQVLMVRGANPAYGLPDAVGFRRAMVWPNSNLFVVSFSSFMDDTTQMADLVLPDRVYLEDWGNDIPEAGPGFQVVGMQQPVVNPLPEMDPRSFPDVLLDISQRLGMDDGLPDTFERVLREASNKLFDLQRGSPQGGSDEAPTTTAFWNKLLQQGGWWDEKSFSTDAPPAPPDLAALVQQQGDPRPSFSSPSSGSNVFYLVPFLSNSLLDGRGAHIPWLQATPDPLTSVTWQTWIDINLTTANRMGLQEGDVVTVTSNEGSIEALVYVHPAMPPNVVGIPVGQGHSPGLQPMEYATKDGERRGANPTSILAAQRDAETGALAWAATRVEVQPTGRNERVSKWEGIVPSYPIGSTAEDIVQVTKGN